MPKIKKKTPKDQVKGQAKNFITRTQAVRKLQISLPDFRRLCIFKGIYPREPRNKRKASKTSTPATTFYYTRDIQYLLHEPLLQKFREHKALGKKIAKALGRGEIGDATRLEKTQKPRARLDHIIKERYPTFVDALRDLDDALSLLYLFASLPSTSTVPTRTIARCQRLCLEFEHFLIATHAVRKTFLSIKGIYYQATVQGQDILWVTPYKFVQQITADVDLRIMGTFIEFYTTLLGFVNYRLYTSIGLAYPPKFDALSSERGGELGAITLQSREANASSKQLQNGTAANGEPSVDSEAATARAEAAVKAIEAAADQSQDTVAATTDVAGEEPEESSKAVDTFTTVAPGGDTLAQPTESSTENAQLFAPFTFYLSRETPRAPLEFLLKAFGCKRVGWPSLLGDGAFTTDENDSRITHQIVDRPPPPVDHQADSGANAAPGSMRMPGRTYVQPQWVWDCVNECRLLRPDLYAPGATLPPHLSPWANPTRGAYDPTVPLEAEAGEDGETGAASEQDDWAGDAEEEDEELASGDDVEPDEEDGEPDKEEEDDWSGFDSEQESQPQPVKAAVSDAKAKTLRKQKQAAQAEEEELERRKGMMPKRKRKLYEKMAYGNNKRNEEAEKLREKRRKIEKERSEVRAGIAR